MALSLDKENGKSVKTTQKAQRNFIDGFALFVFPVIIMILNLM
jgi:hypothetical protein